FGTSSTYSPWNEWLLPVVKFRNDILNVPPTFGSRWCTVQAKPPGGSHFASASASRNARYTFSGVVARTRCRRTVLGMVSSLGLKNHQDRCAASQAGVNIGTGGPPSLALKRRRTGWPI